MSKEIRVHGSTLTIRGIENPLTTNVKGSMIVDDDVTINGNLKVLGSQVQIDVSSMTVEDPVVQLNTTSVGPNPFGGILESGFEIVRGANDPAKLTWMEDGITSTYLWRFQLPTDIPSQYGSKLVFDRQLTLRSNSALIVDNDDSSGASAITSLNKNLLITARSDTLSPCDVEIYSDTGSVVINQLKFPDNPGVPNQVLVTNGVDELSYKDWNVPYDVSLQLTNPPTGTGSGIYISSRTFTISMASIHNAVCLIPPTESSTISIYHISGVTSTNLGTITFNETTTLGTVVLSTDVLLAPGDILYFTGAVHSDNSPDVQMNGIHVILSGVCNL